MILTNEQVALLAATISWQDFSITNPDKLAVSMKAADEYLAWLEKKEAIKQYRTEGKHASLKRSETVLTSGKRKEE